jgi:hypothetical protein
VKKINVAVLCLLCFAIPLVIGAANSGLYIAYPSTPWTKVRSAIVVADAGMTNATGRTWSYFNTNFKTAAYRVPVEASSVSIMISTSASSVTTAGFIYAFTENGPAERVCTFGTASGGLAVRTADAKYFANSILTSNDVWEKTVQSSSSLPVPTTEMARLVINTRGRRYFLVYFTSISAGNADVYFMYQ